MVHLKPYLLAVKAKWLCKFLDKIYYASWKIIENFFFNNVLLLSVLRSNCKLTKEII